MSIAHGKEPKMNKLATVSSTKTIVDKYGFRLTKSLGQNFLVDNNILESIIDSADLTGDDVVFEIGTGVGTLTRELSRHAKKVIAIEIDKKLIPILKETLSGCDNVTIINQDILKTDIEDLVDQYGEGRPIKIVANLPYYITTPIIMKFLESHIKVDSFVLMVQKEVADRIAAKPSTKDYGSLTVAIQYYADSSIMSTVPRSAFFPPPNVDSAVIKLSSRAERPVDVVDEKLFFKVIRGSFSKRRKTILNSLSTYEDFNKETVSKALKSAGIDPIRRGETLTIDEFALLTNSVAAEINSQS